MREGKHMYTNTHIFLYLYNYRTVYFKTTKTVITKIKYFHTTFYGFASFSVIKSMN